MRTRSAFTLVELVVVVMILGILTAVGALKLLNTLAVATDNGLRQTLSVVRDAIELYAAEHDGELPAASDNTEATFKADLAPYLRGDFPKSPVGRAQNNGVKILSDPIVIEAVISPVKGWCYSVATGGFICNSRAISSDGVTRYDQF